MLDIIGFRKIRKTTNPYITFELIRVLCNRLIPVPVPHYLLRNYIKISI